MSPPEANAIFNAECYKICLKSVILLNIGGKNFHGIKGRPMILYAIGLGL